MQLLVVAGHTATILVFLVVGLRTLGRRSMAQLGVVDLVVILLLGSAVETAMVAGNTSLVAGLTSVSALLVLNRLLTTVLGRSPRLRHLVGGTPVLLVHDGEVVEDHLRRAGFTRDDLAEALRQRGEASLQGVRDVVLEPDGTVHVIVRSR